MPDWKTGYCRSPLLCIALDLCPFRVVCGIEHRLRFAFIRGDGANNGNRDSAIHARTIGVYSCINPVLYEVDRGVCNFDTDLCRLCIHSGIVHNSGFVCVTKAVPCNLVDRSIAAYLGIKEYFYRLICSQSIDTLDTYRYGLVFSYIVARRNRSSPSASVSVPLIRSKCRIHSNYLVLYLLRVCSI